MNKNYKIVKFLLPVLLTFSLVSFYATPAVKADTLPAVIGVTYQSHVQNIGWQPWVSDGIETGTDGKGLRVEALNIKLVNAPVGAKIEYQDHVQNIGWQNWTSDGQEIGTNGKGLRVEALKIKLDGMPGYSVEYQAHVQNIGWQNWIKDGVEAGTDGKGLRVEAIRIKIVPKTTIAINSVSLNKTSDTFNVGASDTLNASIDPTTITNEMITWTSSNDKVASVNGNGVISGLSIGTAVITATTSDGNKSASCTVTVKDNKISVDSISLNKTSDTLNIGGTDTLITSINPKNATNKAVNWTTSNNGVVTVDSDGKINAVGAGSVVVSATTVDGSKTVSCSVTVNPSASQSNDDKAKAKATEILSKIITPGMSTLNKELAIHDYIVANTNYDVTGVNNNTTSNEDYTAYGILVNHLGVCEGYAKAFKLLCDYEGITCQVVDDSEIDHAWNIVQLDDKNYYQVDCTWDDPISSDTSNASDNIDHRYFNISDKQMFADHAIDQAEWNSYNYPKCTVDNIDFYSNSSVDAATNNNEIYTDVNNTLSKVDSSGNVTEISDNNATSITYYNGYIYYIYDNSIYRVDSDGENCISIANSSNIDRMYLYNGALYYLNTDDFQIHKLVLDGTYNIDKTILSISYTKYFISNGFLYSEDIDTTTNSYILNKTNLTDMTNKEILTMDSKDNIDGYNDQYINYGNCIYYKKSNALYRVDLDGNNSTFISNNVSNSDGSELNIFENSIYYNSTSDGSWYKMNLDGSSLTKLNF